MRNNKGITLVSVIIYLIVLGIVIGIVSNLTKYFYRNANEMVLSDDTSAQYEKLMNYIVEDVNSGNIQNITQKANVAGEANTLEDYIIFHLADQTMHQYIYDKKNHRIVFQDLNESSEVEKKITLCSKVNSCKFTMNNNNSINVSVTINSVNYTNDFYY